MRTNAIISRIITNPTQLDLRIFLVVVSFILFFSINTNAAESILLEDCNQYEEFCLDISNKEFNSYKVLVNGEAFKGDYRNCNYSVENNIAVGEGVSIRLGVGEYVVETLNIKTGEKSTKEVSIACAESKGLSLSKNLIGDIENNSVVIELDEIEISNYELLLNGENVTESLKPNQDKKISIFKLSELQGTSFFVYQWMFEGKEITGSFQSGFELAQLMNKMSTSVWTWDENRGLLFGGNEHVTYDAITISKLGEEGIMNNFPAATIDIVGNLSLDLPAGNHTIQVRNFTTGIAQTKEVIINNPMASK